MKKKSTKATNPSSGSTSNFKRFLFVFGHSDGVWAKYLRGFTHLVLIEVAHTKTGNKFIVYDPLITNLDVHILYNKLPVDISSKTVLDVKIKPTKINRMLGFKFQTCATILQYIAGISLGCITVKSLYERLIDSSSEWLQSRGIIEVEQWRQSLHL